MKKKPQHVPVTRRALFQRINRVLAKENRCLKANRSERAFPDLGWLYTVDMNRNVVVSSHHDLGELGKELGALKPYEKLVD